MQLYHDSQNITYRKPFGAVTLGSEVSLCLAVSECSNETTAKIRVWTEINGEEWIDMIPSATSDGLFFSAVIKTPEIPCLLWYSFVVRDNETILFYGNNEEKLGGIGKAYSHEAPNFQITVYRDFKIPDWYRNSIAYQIFPDRFNRGNDFIKRSTDCLQNTSKNGPKTILRQNWDDTPSYIKDERGHVTHWDFFGGTLQGITEKLDYLETLGIGTLYLNPIFKALSNHRYDTTDYMEIDPRLGDEESFVTLCKEAEKRGISIILDGVFNHTGNDSIYFDAYQNHNSNGAYHNEDSPYKDWYLFTNKEQTEYESWWGVKDLPALDKNNKDYQDYIYKSKNSVIRHWLKLGAKGWRLDVADELNDQFIKGIKDAICETISDGLLLGEVWEDASNKVSYNTLRKYLLGDELDCVMNYPLRTALIDYLMGRISSQSAGKTLMSLYENYPRPASDANFNLIGSHDRSRILTMLSGFDEKNPSSFENTNEISDEALRKFHLICILQMTLPGVPCIYYGDEAGLTGTLDPDNRKSFPWGKENKNCFEIYRSAISLRKEWDVFVNGDFRVLETESENVFSFSRKNEKDEILVYVNRSPWDEEKIMIKTDNTYQDLISSNIYSSVNGVIQITLPPCGTAVLREEKKLTETNDIRSCGVLCHISSLPSKWGSGDLGEEAKNFVLKLKEARQTFWQILPLNPVDEYDSPYATTSAFAGNTLLISPEYLYKLGLIKKGDLAKAEKNAKKLINTNNRKGLKELKTDLLKCAFEKFVPDQNYSDFCEKENFWLKDFCLFETLKTQNKTDKWQNWPKDQKSKTLSLSEEMKKEIDFHCFCQFIFYLQWNELHDFARKNGVKIIGDLPFYVGLCGADVWSNQELFCLNEEGYGTLTAGVPPDYFSEEGQIWNNPLYNWINMEKEGYAWWLSRLKQAFERYDLLRLDHFRGFEQYFSIPSGKKAICGFWKFGPGLKLFEKAKETFGTLPILAEDLGEITIQVKNLLSACGFLGTDVFQFSFNERLLNKEYRAKENAVLYSGTHDNQTLFGFLSENKEEPLISFQYEELILALYESAAPIVILPLQDILGLDDKARMNVPGKAENNWKWQFESSQFSEDKIRAIRTLAEKTNRF